MRRFWAVLAAIAFAVPAMLGNMWPTPGPGFVVATGPAPAAYTIAVFGDVQEATDGGDNLTHLQTMADDVTAKYTGGEQIVAVLQVGDYAQNGTFMPLPAGCSGATKTLTIGECIAQGTEPACSAYNGGDGCEWDGAACLTCAFTNTVNTEWTRGNGVFDDFEPGFDTVDGIPFMFPRGNHDNLGVGDPDLDDLGIEPHWDTAAYEALETAFASSPQLFEHLTFQDFGVEGVARVFRISMGGRNVNVVAPAYDGGSAYDASQISWVQTEGALRGEPWILLAHDLSENGGTMLAATVNATPTPPGLIAAISGHSPSARAVSIDADGDRPVLRAVWDMSDVNPDGPTWAEYLLVDFWPDTDEIQVRQRNPVLDTETVLLARTSFAWPTGLVAATPYDLSPIETELAIAFDNATPSSARPAWPIPPTITSTCAATNDATLASCLSAGGRHVTVAAGTYTGSYTISQDDIWLDMDNAAKIVGGFGIAGTVNRLRMTGGEVEGGFAVNFSAGSSDMLFKNVHFDLAYVGTVGGTMTICSGTGTIDRMAFVDTTIVASRWTLLSANDCVQNDLIIANVDAWSNYQPGDPGNDEGVIRFMHTNRTLVVDSHLRISPSGKAVVRQHYGNNHTLYVDNIIDSAATVWGGFWIDTDAGLGEQDDINNTFIIRNELYQSFDGTFRDVAIDDSNPGNGIDVTYVYIHDNTAHHLSDTTFGWSTPAATTVDAAGNTKFADFTAFPPFTGGADH